MALKKTAILAVVFLAGVFVQILRNDFVFFLPSSALMEVLPSQLKVLAHGLVFLGLFFLGEKIFLRYKLKGLVIYISIILTASIIWFALVIFTLKFMLSGL